MLWGDTKSAHMRDASGPKHRTVTELFRTTAGTARLDLSSSTYPVLTPKMDMQALPTGIFGPLPKNTLGLLLGKNSTTMKGVLVAPGVIDSDSMGEIKIMAHSPQDITVIQSGQRVTQLILLPTIPIEKAVKQEQRSRGFGSSDAIRFRPLISNALSFYCIFKKSLLKVFWILVQMFLLYLKNIGLMNGLSRL